MVFSAIVNHELAIKCLAWTDFDDTSMRLLPPFLEKPHSVNALCIKDISLYFGQECDFETFFEKKDLFVRMLS